MNGNGRFLTITLAIMAPLITAGIIATVGMLINMGGRLAMIETTINENRAARERSDRQLDARLERLETDMYERRRNGESE